jgi:hypothetical protein
MEITPHLSEAELAEFISDPSRGLGTHLEICDSCLGEVARLRESTAGMKSVADRPQELWDRQRAAIRNRIAATSVQPVPVFQRMAWAPVLALMILAGLLLSGGTPVSPPTTPVAVVDPDHELLLSVERVMQSNGPVALEPATYFVQEIRQETDTHSTRNQEIPHAN